jgi:SsrA-binding protein
MDLLARPLLLACSPDPLFPVRTSSPRACSRVALATRPGSVETEGRGNRAGLRARRDPTAKSGKKKKEAPDREHDNERLIAQNRSARHEYEVIDTLECGIVLVGSEVKSLRSGKISLDEAYGRMKQGEVWLVGCDIAEYTQAHQFNHEPRRPRKLLMHRREVKKFASLAYEKGLTLVPLKMYFKEGRAKVLMGICKGRKLYDKRENLKQKSMKRDIDRAMRRG